MTKYYATGELANLCQVSVRTVQFYDKEGLLKPSDHSEGGRRLYGEAELSRLELIGVYKRLGLSLKDIKEVLLSPSPNASLLDFLQTSKDRINSEIEDKQKQVKIIENIQKQIANNSLNNESLKGVEKIMEKSKKMWRVYIPILVVGILLDIAEIATLVYSIISGKWWWFGGCMLAIIPVVIAIVLLYFYKAKYVCSHCGEEFRAPFRKFFIAKHTPTTRYVECPHCHTKSYCKEIYNEKEKK